MRTVERISHTADIGIKITADSLEELFRGAFEGMARVQKNAVSKGGGRHSEALHVTAPDRTALLVDFLSDVHTLSDIHNVVFTELAIESLSGTELRGRVSGPEVHEFDEDIKAVTHSQADITENEDGNLETVIVFDL